MRGLHDVLLRLDGEVVVEDLLRLRRLTVLVRRREQALGGERGAAGRTQRLERAAGAEEVKAGSGDRRIQVGAALIDVQRRGVIIEAAAVLEDRRVRPLHDRESRVELRIDVRFRHGDAVDPVLVVELGRKYGRAAAVRYARGDDDGVLGRDPLAAAVVIVVVAGPEHAVEDEEGELDGLQHVLAPVRLRVLAGMGVLEGKAVGRRFVERLALAVAQLGREVGVLARRIRVGPQAGDQIDRVVLQIVRAGARALVRVGDRASVIEAPLAGRGDGAIDPARAGGGGGDDAGRFRVEAVRHLHHHSDVFSARAVVGKGDELGAGNQALAQGVFALRVDVRAVEHAVAAARGEVHQRPIVVVDGQRAELGDRRVLRVGEGRR